MKKKVAIASVMVLLVAVSIVFADGGFRRIREFLKGFEEVPAVSTVADGEFRARISNDQTQIQWELSYSDLESAVQQAHIHLGQKDVNGGISVFLCTNLGNGPAGYTTLPAFSRDDFRYDHGGRRQPEHSSNAGGEESRIEYGRAGRVN